MNDKNQAAENAQGEAALRHFRESVHAWSEREQSRPRAVELARPSILWRVMSRPVGVWGMAAVLAVSAVTVPVERHRQHVQQLAEAQRQAQEAQLKRDE